MLVRGAQAAAVPPFPSPRYAPFSPWCACLPTGFTPVRLKSHRNSNLLGSSRCPVPPCLPPFVPLGNLPTTGCPSATHPLPHSSGLRSLPASKAGNPSRYPTADWTAPCTTPCSRQAYMRHARATMGAAGRAGGGHSDAAIVTFLGPGPCLLGICMRQHGCQGLEAYHD